MVVVRALGFPSEKKNFPPFLVVHIASFNKLSYRVANLVLEGLSMSTVDLCALDEILASISCSNEPPVLFLEPIPVN